MHAYHVHERTPVSYPPMTQKLAHVTRKATLRYILRVAVTLKHKCVVLDTHDAVLQPLNEVDLYHPIKVNYRKSIIIKIALYASGNLTHNDKIANRIMAMEMHC